MSRVRSTQSVRARRKKTLKAAKGYYGHKSIGWKSAQEQVRQSKKYSFRDRKQTKRNFRSLWIKRINAAARMHDISYSNLVNGLKKAGIEMNRKMLADIAVENLEQFALIVIEAKKALEISPVIVVKETVLTKEDKKPKVKVLKQKSDDKKLRNIRRGKNRNGQY